MFGFIELIKAFKAEKRVRRDCYAAAALVLAIYIFTVAVFAI